MRTLISLASIAIVTCSLGACASGNKAGKPLASLTKEECAAHLSQNVPVGHKMDQAIQKDMACADIVKK